MADVAEVLATYDALVGVALGAGLTYGFSALNRRHQEAREDKTRWYQARLAAYTEFTKPCLMGGSPWEPSAPPPRRPSAGSEMRWA
jgi:hypothetical protein